MHTTEHTDLDGDALTVTRNGDLVWVTVTKGGDELTFGPISAHALEASESLGSYVRHEDPARNADGRPFCTAELDGFACSREDGHDGPHVAATCDVQNSICEVWPAAESHPLTPDAITDEMVERARVSLREHGILGSLVPSLARAVLTAALTAALTEPPARPEGAEEIDEHLRQANAAALGGALTPEQRRALADHLAGFGYRNPLDRAEDGAA